MNNQVISDEIDALSSILYGDGEFQVLTKDEEEVVIAVNPHALKSQNFTLYLTLGTKQYPHLPPKLSVQSLMSWKNLSSIRACLEEEAEKLKGGPMILNLVQHLLDFVTGMGSTSTEHTSTQADAISSSSSTVILQLDHVRSRQTYAKTLTKWFSEFDLKGILLFYRKLVFLLVGGEKENLQCYLKRHRTQNVDVDSSGRPCKERLLTVIGEIEERLDIDHSSILKQVDVEERAAYDEFWSSTTTLRNVYQKFILPQCEQKKSRIKVTTHQEQGKTRDSN